MGALRRKNVATRGGAELRRLIGLAAALGADQVGGPLSRREKRLLRDAGPPPTAAEVRAARRGIQRLEDPLGARFCEIVPPLSRRSLGAFYTQAPVVEAMCQWVLEQSPARVVDAGSGSGRFTAQLCATAPATSIIAVDIDPAATLLTRAVLSCLGGRGVVLNTDFTALELDPIDEPTAFIGNPPYVRHHELTAQDKARARRLAKELGVPFSGLAGLHAYFFLAAARNAKPGDFGSFITSAEWLDVGYGSTIRALFAGFLGGKLLQVLTPQAIPFDDAMTTAAISCFAVGARHRSARLKSAASVGELCRLRGGRSVAHRQLGQSSRWSPLLKGLRAPSANETRLGDIARVHRGVVTGNNRYFVMARERAIELGIEEYCRPAITSAKEIIEAGGAVRRSERTKVVLDLDGDLDIEAIPALADYLANGIDDGIPTGYIASHRKPWWRIGAPRPAPIVASYMARQPPTFALNPDGLLLLNIAHGIYPKEPMSRRDTAKLVAALNEHREHFRGRGRTYHGGLEKFEPREMENLRLPCSFIR